LTPQDKKKEKVTYLPHYYILDEIDADIPSNALV
jgi:hypothetical protein